MLDNSLSLDASRQSIRSYRPALPQGRAIQPAPSGPASLFGIPVFNHRRSEAINFLTDRILAGKKTRLAFLNAHCANIACRDWQYRCALMSATAVFPDGIGVAIACRLNGTPLTANLNGTDLFLPLCRSLEKEGKSVFLLGGRPGIALKVAEKLSQELPALKIAGTRHGYFMPQQEDELITSINRAKPDVIFVALGVPQQDVWLARVQDRFDAKLVAGVGGLFDFMSGATRRAPRRVRELGMEWVFRLMQEPQRMWKRYLVGNATFLARATFASLSARLARLRTKTSRGLKRGLDVCVAGTALTLLSPVLLATAALIKLESKGPALFRQVRIGENGQAFEMLKFRSMYDDAEDRLAGLLGQSDRDDITFKLKADPRVTGVGRFIRKYSIDELPQFLNVMMGSMSVVGPRPALPREVEKYSSRAMGRLNGKPGITGPWQVGGRADISFDQMVEMDIDYLERRSVWRDIGLILATPFAVIAAKGAY